MNVQPIRKGIRPKRVPTARLMSTRGRLASGLASGVQIPRGVDQHAEHLRAGPAADQHEQPVGDMAAGQRAPFLFPKSDFEKLNSAIGPPTSALLVFSPAQCQVFWQSGAIISIRLLVIAVQNNPVFAVVLTAPQEHKRESGVAIQQHSPYRYRPPRAAMRRCVFCCWRPHEAH